MDRTALLSYLELARSQVAETETHIAELKTLILDLESARQPTAGQKRLLKKFQNILAMRQANLNWITDQLDESE